MLDCLLSISHGGRVQDYFSNELGYNFYRKHITRSSLSDNGIDGVSSPNQYSFPGGYAQSVYNYLTNR